jgi:hypothetical protein
LFVSGLRTIGRRSHLPAQSLKKITALMRSTRRNSIQIAHIFVPENAKSVSVCAGKAPIARLRPHPGLSQVQTRAPPPIYIRRICIATFFIRNRAPFSARCINQDCVRHRSAELLRFDQKAAVRENEQKISRGAQLHASWPGAVCAKGVCI